MPHILRPLRHDELTYYTRAIFSRLRRRPKQTKTELIKYLSVTINTWLTQDHCEAILTHALETNTIKEENGFYKITKSKELPINTNIKELQ